MSCLTYFCLTRFPTAKSEFQTIFETLSRYSHNLRLLKSIYRMTNSGKLLADDLIEWLLEVGLIQSKCQMSIYYKYAPDGTIVFCFILY